MHYTLLRCSRQFGLEALLFIIFFAILIASLQQSINEVLWHWTVISMANHFKVLTWNDWMSYLPECHFIFPQFGRMALGAGWWWCVFQIFLIRNHKPPTAPLTLQTNKDNLFARGKRFYRGAGMGGCFLSADKTRAVKDRDRYYRSSLTYKSKKQWECERGRARNRKRDCQRRKEREKEMGTEK